MFDVAVIGAGIGGLTLSYRLEQVGCRVLLLEASSQAGGLIKTLPKDGYLLELGPNSTLLKKPLEQLINDLGLKHEVLYPDARVKKRYLGTFRVKRNTLSLVATPRSPLAALFHPVMGFSAKLRALYEPFIAKSTAVDESVSFFVTRRFGKTVTDTVVAPLLSGIWACDIKTLSTRSALSKLWDLEQSHGSVLRGIFRGQKEKAKNRFQMVTLRTGMETLPQTLAARLGRDTLQLNTSVKEIQASGTGFTLSLCPSCQASTVNLKQTIDAKNVVITSGASTAASLLAPFSPGLAARIGAIPYAPLGILHLAYQAGSLGHPLDAFGFLLPPRQQHPLLGAIFSSSIFPGRTPSFVKASEETHLVTCFLGGATNPELADSNNQAIQQKAVSELNALLQARANPKVLAATYYPGAIPNYPQGHFQTQEQLAALSKQYHGLHVLTNWDIGLGVSDRVEQAERLANTLLNKLSSTEPFVKQRSVG